jgi:hypothetical protein
MMSRRYIPLLREPILVMVRRFFIAARSLYNLG